MWIALKESKHCTPSRVKESPSLEHHSSLDARCGNGGAAGHTQTDMHAVDMQDCMCAATSLAGEPVRPKPGSNPLSGRPMRVVRCTANSAQGAPLRRELSIVRRRRPGLPDAADSLVPSTRLNLSGARPAIHTEKGDIREAEGAPAIVATHADPLVAVGVCEDLGVVGCARHVHVCRTGACGFRALSCADPVFSAGHQRRVLHVGRHARAHRLPCGSGVGQRGRAGPNQAPGQKPCAPATSWRDAARMASGGGDDPRGEPAETKDPSCGSEVGSRSCRGVMGEHPHNEQHFSTSASVRCVVRTTRSLTSPSAPGVGWRTVGGEWKRYSFHMGLEKQRTPQCSLSMNAYTYTMPPSPCKVVQGVDKKSHPLG